MERNKILCWEFYDTNVQVPNRKEQNFVRRAIHCRSTSPQQNGTRFCEESHTLQKSKSQVESRWAGSCAWSRTRTRGWWWTLWKPWNRMPDSPPERIQARGHAMLRRVLCTLPAHKFRQLTSGRRYLKVERPTRRTPCSLPKRWTAIPEQPLRTSPAPNRCAQSSSKKQRSKFRSFKTSRFMLLSIHEQCHFRRFFCWILNLMLLLMRETSNAESKRCLFACTRP